MLDEDEVRLRAVAIRNLEACYREIVVRMDLEAIRGGHRDAEQDIDASRRERCLVAEWEIPVVEVVFNERNQADSLPVP